MRQHAARAAQPTCRPYRSSGHERKLAPGRNSKTKAPEASGLRGSQVHVNARERYLGGEPSFPSPLALKRSARSTGAGREAGLTFESSCRCDLYIQHAPQRLAAARAVTKVGKSIPRSGEVNEKMLGKPEWNRGGAEGAENKREDAG